MYARVYAVPYSWDSAISNMIDLQLYRLRIGYYNLTRICKLSNHNICSSHHISPDINNLLYILIYLVYAISIYYMMYIFNYLLYAIYSLSIQLAFRIESRNITPKFHRIMSINHSRIFHRDIFGSWYISFVSIAVLPSFLFLCFKHRKHIFRKKTSFFISVGMFFLSIIRLTLIVVCNPSIINPGPWQPSIIYQNVQGLIPFGELDKPNPTLNLEKILELQSYVNINKPDIVILNETWLKKSISDNEIFPTRQYKMFREDRSDKTHPPDPDNSKNSDVMVVVSLLQLELIWM